MDKDAILASLNDRDLSDIHPNLRPKKAASLIVWREGQSGLKILMGRRAKGLVFMPGKYVFPGGARERGDSLLKPASPLHAVDQRRLGPGGQGLALAAIRECFEETGLRVAGTKAQISRSPLWLDYTAPGLRPDLSRLLFFARAITPPRRIRRFDTYFFAVNAGNDIEQEQGLPRTGEIEETVWVSLQDARQLDVAPMTRAILDEISVQAFTGKKERPFYFVRGGKFVRGEIA